MAVLTYDRQAEKWGVFEVTAQGVSEGNPFTERTIRGTFASADGNERITTDGFYDGDGVYKVRFMPSFEGEYTFSLEGNFAEGTDGSASDSTVPQPLSGSFTVIAPSEGNHGPVRVANTYHFAYEDGTPYYSIGTTCYVWELQSDERIEETFESLKKSAFNKIRFCIFPKHYDYNLGEPRSYPYEGTPTDSSVLTKENFMEYWTGMGKKDSKSVNHWDFERFNPAHFRHIETCIARLRDCGIEADLIVMHPYDRWGFSEMTKGQDDLYWNYVVRRFAAYRNVWWSLANEYDLMPQKSIADWERYARILCEKDPYRHPRSIHNCFALYDHTRPWVTHCSIQRTDLYKSSELADELRIRYGKPVVFDEIMYEGNIQHSWGNISGEEMTRRFWEAACRGAYPGHGETYLNPEEVLWWSHGGVLRGESWKRFALLHEIMCETPGVGLRPNPEGRGGFDGVCAVPEDLTRSGYYLIYYGRQRPSFRDFYFDDESEYTVRVIDTWNMTVEERGTFRGKFRIELPGTEFMAVQIRRVEK
ncbi:MAG: DUF5605 domain-containing protein [Eubacteriales bacterium]|nr:DUF5605 domain-containing protein [Eubacteriales bacterium]